MENHQVAPNGRKAVERVEIDAVDAVVDQQRSRDRGDPTQRTHLARVVDGVVPIVDALVANATAGPGSDIDILIHFQGTDEQLSKLHLWLEGWSLSLAETNYLRTGYRSDGLLDIHIITDEDIANKTSYAVKIGAVTDPARELPMREAK